MSLVGFKAQNHRQQTGRRGPNPRVDDRATTWETFDPLHERFRFPVDVAAQAHNAKLPRFFSPEQDGLARSWAGERVWCNPPYSDIGPWLEKAWCEHQGGCELIVMLLPANRTEQRWWQVYIEAYRLAGLVRVEFLPGRLRFIAAGKTEVGPNERPPFGCCLVIWGSDHGPEDEGEVSVATKAVEASGPSNLRAAVAAAVDGALTPRHRALVNALGGYAAFEMFVEELVDAMVAAVE